MGGTGPGGRLWQGDCTMYPRHKVPNPMCVSPEEQDNEEDFDFHRAVGTSELWVCK